MKRFATGLLVLPLVMLVSCGQEPESGVEPARREDSNRQVFEVRGEVVRLLPERKQIRIKHEEIPDYMPAMTMPFDVKDTNEMAGLAPGDLIQFRLTVTKEEGWIDQIRKTGAAAGDSGETPKGSLRGVAPPPGASAAPPPDVDIETLEPGDPVPNFTFTNQAGTSISLAQFRGQALGINFIFTRCPYPTFCPRLSNRFASAQEALAGMPQGPTNWHLLTISFDPEFDTPQVLKGYGQTYSQNPARWTIATGSLRNITELGQHFGLIFWRDETGSISHNLRTVVIDANGRLEQVFDGGDWVAEELVEAMTRAARKK